MKYIIATDRDRTLRTIDGTISYFTSEDVKKWYINGYIIFINILFFI